MIRFPVAARAAAAKFSLCLLWFSFSAGAADAVRLLWDANEEPAVAGYRVYLGGASRHYTNSWPVEGRTNTTTTISNVVPGVTYFLAVTARDTNGLESPFSEELAFTRPRPPVRLRLSVNLQSALKLGDEWEDGPQFVTFEFPATGQRFYRASVAARLE